MQESSIQETPTAAQVAQESRTLRPRGGDASKVTPGAQLNMEPNSGNLQVVPNLLVATPSEPEDPSDQVPVADDSSSIVPPDRSIQLRAADLLRSHNYKPLVDTLLSPYAKFSNSLGISGTEYAPHP